MPLSVYRCAKLSECVSFPECAPSSCLLHFLVDPCLFSSRPAYPRRARAFMSLTVPEKTDSLVVQGYVKQCRKQCLGTYQLGISTAQHNHLIITTFYFTLFLAFANFFHRLTLCKQIMNELSLCLMARQNSWCSTDGSWGWNFTVLLFRRTKYFLLIEAEVSSKCQLCSLVWPCTMSTLVSCGCPLKEGRKKSLI